MQYQLKKYFIFFKYIFVKLQYVTPGLHQVENEIKIKLKIPYYFFNCALSGLEIGDGFVDPICAEHSQSIFQQTDAFKQLRENSLCEVFVIFTHINDKEEIFVSW